MMYFNSTDSLICSILSLVETGIYCNCELQLLLGCLNKKTAAAQRIHQNSGVKIKKSAKMKVQKSNNLQLTSPSSGESVQMH